MNYTIVKVFEVSASEFVASTKDAPQDSWRITEDRDSKSFRKAVNTGQQKAFFHAEPWGPHGWRLTTRAPWQEW